MGVFSELPPAPNRLSGPETTLARGASYVNIRLSEIDPESAFSKRPRKV
jgi:hypothetical protein